MKRQILFLTILIFAGLMSFAQSGYFIVPSGAYIHMSGSPSIVLDNTSFTNNGNYVSASDEMLFTGNVAQNINGSSNTSVFNLSISNSGGITSQSGLLTTNDLTIASGGKFNIAPGKALTVNGTTSNSGTLTLKSDATGIASFIDNGFSGSGTYNVENYLIGAGGSSPNGKFWYTGSPVSAANSGVFPAAGDNKLWYFNEVSGNYTEIDDNTTSLFVMKGYIARMGATTTVNYTGTPNTGDKTLPLTLTTPGSTYAGYNLVCNPFPSSVDLLNVTTSPTNIESTVWYRSGSTFATYNYFTSDATNGATEFVPPMYAFWVKVSSDNSVGSVTLNQTARTHSSQAYYKVNNKTNVFRMNVSDGINTDETIVGFYQNAQDIFDNYDSRKMISQDAPQIYTLCSDLTNVAINGQHEMTTNEERIVPLGFKTNVSGTFTFNATNLDDFDSSIPVYLEDIQQGVMQDLRQLNTYTFSSGIIDDANRFKLHFGNLTTSIPTIVETAVSVYAVDKTIYVNTPKISSIEVYDVLGKLIMNQQSAQGLNKLQLDVETGVYVVKVLTGTQVTTQKVMINK